MSEAPRKALSPYFLFVKKHRDQLRKDHPELSVPALGRKLGEMWRKLDEKARQPFVDESTKGKTDYQDQVRKHKETNPTWEPAKRRKIKHRKKKEESKEPAQPVHEEPVDAEKEE
jgi:hypothetical protein